jgi:hypothetical protein
VKAAHDDPAGRLTLVTDKLGLMPPVIETRTDPPQRFQGQEWADTLTDLVEQGVFYEESAGIFRLTSLQEQ